MINQTRPDTDDQTGIFTIPAHPSPAQPSPAIPQSSVVHLFHSHDPAIRHRLVPTPTASSNPFVAASVIIIIIIIIEEMASFLR